MAKVHGVHGEAESETYLVNVGLPNNVVFFGVRVTKGLLVGGADVLIGMNIINRGDFAVTDYGGLTKFSFRVPSVEHIDFVAGFNQRPPRPQFSHGGKGSGRPKGPKTSGKGKRKR